MLLLGLCIITCCGLVCWFACVCLLLFGLDFAVAGFGYLRGLLCACVWVLAGLLLGLFGFGHACVAKGCFIVLHSDWFEVLFRWVPSGVLLYLWFVMVLMFVCCALIVLFIYMLWFVLLNYCGFCA